MVRGASARSVKPCADFTNTRQRNAAYEFTGTAYQWPVAEQALPDAASAVTVAEANLVHSIPVFGINSIALLRPQ